MKFTFGLLLYNQQNYVLETLESLKFQIEHYGKDICCHLIINDDCSSDDSMSYVNKWIAQNRFLFDKVLINESKINLGTVKGQQFIIDNCESDCYKLLACDDVLSSVNIFECFNSLDDKSLSTYLRVELINGVLHINEDVLMKAFYMQKNMNSISAMRKGCYLHTPSTIYKKCLYYEAKCADLNSKFNLFEDDPTWYQMIKNTAGLKINFVEDAIVLYRVSNSSVSNSGSVNSPFITELKQLTSIYESDSTGLEHLYFMSKNSNLPKCLRFDKYVDYMNRKRYKRFCNRSNDYLNLIQKFHCILDREQAYYDQIKKTAEEFKGKYLV